MALGYELTFTAVSRAMWWYQGNCARGACTIADSGEACARARMYLRLRGENPRMPGKRSWRRPRVGRSRGRPSPVRTANSGCPDRRPSRWPPTYWFIAAIARLRPCVTRGATDSSNSGYHPGSEWVGGATGNVASPSSTPGPRRSACHRHSLNPVLWSSGEAAGTPIAGPPLTRTTRRRRRLAAWLTSDRFERLLQGRGVRLTG